MTDTTGGKARGADRPRPKTIVVASPKGGCGKSTIARAIAVRAAQLGRNVVALDFDAQRTLTKWFAKRPEEGRTNIRVEALGFDDWTTRVFDLQHEVDASGRLTAELLVIDLPPGVEQAMGTVRGMIERADLVPLHRRFDRLVVFGMKLRQPLGIDGQGDGASNPRLPRDQPSPLEGQQHLIPSPGDQLG
jgi:hypothetical protein